MLLDKLLALYKHSARTATGVEHTALIRFKHIDKQLHNASRSIELSTLLAFSQRKFAKEIFKHMSQQVGAVGRCVESAVADQIYKFAQTGRVKIRTGKNFWQNTF